MPSVDREVLIEFYHVGNAVKVSALDVDSGIEVSIVGAPEMHETALKNAALRKLRYVMQKHAGQS